MLTFVFYFNSFGGCGVECILAECKLSQTFQKNQCDSLKRLKEKSRMVFSVDLEKVCSARE